MAAAAAVADAELLLWNLKFNLVQGIIAVSFMVVVELREQSTATENIWNTHDRHERNLCPPTEVKEVV
jgi:hypothetical protein